MQKNYDQSLKYVLLYEGGYTNDPNDPGGPTNYGIIQREYDAYRKKNGATTQSVKYITKDEYSEIYRKQYADPVLFDELPSGIDFAILDYSINSGIGRAVKDLQRYLGFTGLDIDGGLGKKTLAAVGESMRKDGEKVIKDYCEIRLAFLQRLSTFQYFGKGWTRRVMGDYSGFQTNDMGVIDHAVMLVRNDSAGPQPVPYIAPVEPVLGKGVLTQPPVVPIQENQNDPTDLTPIKVEPVQSSLPLSAEHEDTSNFVVVTEITKYIILNRPTDGKIDYRANSPIIRMAGEKVSLISVYNQWCFIVVDKYPDIKGWIHSSYLKQTV